VEGDPPPEAIRREADEAATFELTGPQARLAELLTAKAEVLGTIYVGTRMVMVQMSNTDRHALAAQGVRELMEKLPRHLRLPVTEPARSRSERLRDHASAWEAAKNASQCWGDGQWRGEVDDPLRDYLVAEEQFIAEYLAEAPTRAASVRILVRSLDPLAHPLLEPAEDLWVKRLDRLNRYFEGVAHHQITPSAGDFDGRVEELESFLLDFMLPRTYEIEDALDALIEEAERHADG
jgi:hypothetical protein